MIKCSSLESSRWDASNGGRFMALALIDSELLTKVSKHKNVNNSVSINARAMKWPPFDTSHIDDSNELRFMFLRPIDIETPWYFVILILTKLLKSCILAKILNRDNSASSDYKTMKCSSLKSSRRDASNGGRFIALASIYSELLVKNSKQKNANSLASIDAKAMKRPPFDASHRDDSNELHLIILRLIDIEIT